ncbi:orotidine-5'-phosphate decarboxylase [Aerococcus urinaeequi]|uniref:orotidine-5'-phosphate decarboxylase n=1 Tax=Aerococcus urinaeequi TaxID=51665 RepID=UPI003EDAFFB4
MDPKKPIIALDFPNQEEVFAFLDQFQGQQLNVKVGMELFYAGGTAFLKELQAKGHDIFLDLKLHDIPNTVERAMAILASTGVAMVNVHAAGGKEMMQAALRGLEAGSTGKRPMLISVTQLTSTSTEQMNEEQGIPGEVLDSVLRYAKLTKASGLDGVVCSPLEAAAIKEACGADFQTITPGIRLATSVADDQKRIMTPSQAAQGGSDYIVVGRPITQADNSKVTYDQITADWSGQ